MMLPYNQLPSLTCLHQIYSIINEPKDFESAENFLQVLARVERIHIIKGRN